MNTLEAIRSHRSIRQFKIDPVDREILERLLEATTLSPSAKNSQT